MKGTYRLNNKWASRISREGTTVHLGTYDTEEEAAEVYDVGCLIFGRPISAYNYPSKKVETGLVQKVLVVLREKDILTMEDIVKITNRFEVITTLAEKLSEISDHDRKEESS